MTLLSKSVASKTIRVKQETLVRLYNLMMKENEDRKHDERITSYDHLLNEICVYFEEEFKRQEEVLDTALKEEEEEILS